MSCADCFTRRAQAHRRTGHSFGSMSPLSVPRLDRRTVTRHRTISAAIGITSSMLALFSILFALGLLGITVYALHRYQTMEVEFNVDRNMPLPSLDPSSIEKPAGKTADKPAQRIPRAENTIRTKPVNSKPDTAKGAVKSWQDSVTQLKNQGKYAEAEQLCQQHFPLWGAYNQVCMLIRAEIKANTLSKAQHEQRIAALFKMAAIAEFLHDKTSEHSHLSNNQLRKLNLDEISNLDFPYGKIGYAHLRLIRKSDIKHMLELWGRPPAHLTPREFHSEWWQRSTSALNGS